MSIDVTADQSIFNNRWKSEIRTFKPRMHPGLEVYSLRMQTVPDDSGRLPGRVSISDMSAHDLIELRRAIDSAIGIDTKHFDKILEIFKQEHVSAHDAMYDAQDYLLELLGE